MNACAILRPMAILLLVAGCSTVRVNTDYDKGTDFSKFKTFSQKSPPRGSRNLKGYSQIQLVQTLEDRERLVAPLALLELSGEVQRLAVHQADRILEPVGIGPAPEHAGQRLLVEGRIELLGRLHELLAAVDPKKPVLINVVVVVGAEDAQDDVIRFEFESHLPQLHQRLIRAVSEDPEIGCRIKFVDQ